MYLLVYCLKIPIKTDSLLTQGLLSPNWKLCLLKYLGQSKSCMCLSQLIISPKKLSTKDTNLVSLLTQIISSLLFLMPEFNTYFIFVAQNTDTDCVNFFPDNNPLHRTGTPLCWLLGHRIFDPKTWQVPNCIVTRFV